MGDLFAIFEGAAEQAAPFVTITLAGKPRGKGRHRSRVVIPKSGRPFVHQYPDPETVEYEKALAWRAKAAMKGRALLDGPLAIRVFAMIPVPASWSHRDRDAALTGRKLPTSRPDWDNYGKITDALNGIVWNDDAQIVRALTVKEYAEHPGLIVEVYRI